MATFCTNCGAALPPGTRFCSGCGATVAPAAGSQAGATAPPPPGAPVTQPAYSAPPPPGAPLPPPSGGSGLKVLFIVLGIIIVFGAIAAAGLAWLGYKAKSRIESVAREYGVDPSKPAGPSARRVDVCSLITKEEAGEILGAGIERVEPSGDECQYFAKAPSQEEREREIARLQESLEKSKGSGNPQEIENLTKALMSGMAGGTGPSFSVSVDWENGRTMIGAMKFVTGTAPGAGETKMSEQVSGIGDEAILGPMNSVLIFRKGATGVQIDLRMMPDARERGIAIAKVVEGRLRL